MNKVFSDHVAALAAKEDTDLEVLDAAWTVLRSALQSRGIYSEGPGLLGYNGTTWDDEDAQQDFVHDAYCRAILSRLRGLHRNLLQSGNIEMLVKRNLRNFVGERQRRHDPAGDAIFQNLKVALLELCRTGFLTRIGKESADDWKTDDQLCFQGEPQSDVATTEQVRVALEQTGIQFEGLENLLRISEASQAPLLDAIRRLAECGCTHFSVKTLKSGLVELATAAGISLASVREQRFSDSDAEFLENVRTVSPDSGYEQSEHYENLFREVHEAIDQLPKSDQIKSRWHSVTEHFREVAMGKGGQGSASTDQLAERFGTCRSTTHDDISAVRELCRRILAKTSTKRIGDRNG